MKGSLVALALAAPRALAIDGKAGGQLSSLRGFSKIIASGVGEDLSHDDDLFAKVRGWLVGSDGACENAQSAYLIASVCGSRSTPVSRPSYPGALPLATCHLTHLVLS